MSATIYNFSSYQQKATQINHLRHLGWDADSFDYTDGKALNVYLVDKSQQCLRFFNCDLEDIHGCNYGNNHRLHCFLQGWELIQHASVHKTPKHQCLTFQLAKHVIATLPQWKNIQKQQLLNQLAKNSHLIVLIDQHSQDKPIELVLVQSPKEHLSPWRIHHLLGSNHLRGDARHTVPIWDFQAEK